MSALGERIERQRQVLSTLLLTTYGYQDLPEDFTPDCFEGSDHRGLFEKIKAEFIDSGKPSNLVALGLKFPDLKPLLLDVTYGAITLNGRLRQVASTLKNHQDLAEFEQPQEPEPKIDVSQFSPISSSEIKSTLNLTIKSDDDNKLLAFLGMLAAYTEDSQVNLLFNAPSSTGKSYIPTEICKLFPPQDVMVIGGASPTAFFHSGKFDKDQDSYMVDLERKILIFLDQPHDQLLQRLRSLLSHDQKVITHKITDKTQKGGTKTKTIYLKGFCSVIFCTASLKTDEQEATRCFLLSPETSQEKIKQGIEQKIKREADPDAFDRLLEADPGRRMLKERIRAIRQEHITDILINNPEKELILKAFLSPKMLKPRHQRDIGRIVSLVKTFALVNLWWRNRNGSTITANVDDVDEAFLLWEKIAESQELNLAPYVFQLFKEIILPAFNEKNQGDIASEHKTGVSRKEVLQKHSQVYGRALAIDKLRFEILPQLEASGLIVQEADTADRRNKLICPA